MFLLKALLVALEAVRGVFLLEALMIVLKADRQSFCFVLGFFSAGSVVNRLEN